MAKFNSKTFNPEAFGPEVRSYVATIAAATRQDAALQLGASTRAAIALIHGAQACALLAGRDYTFTLSESAESA